MAGENDPASFSVARPFCSCGEDVMLPLKLCFMCLVNGISETSAPNIPCGCLITQVNNVLYCMHQLFMDAFDAGVPAAVLP